MMTNTRQFLSSRVSKGTTQQSYPPPTSTALYNRIPERVICSIYLSQKISATVGLCFINTATGQVTLSGLLDSPTYVRTIHKLNIHVPTEIVVPHSYISPTPNKLVSILRVNIPENVKIVDIEKRFFSNSSGMDEIAKLSFDKDRQYLQTVLTGQCLVLSALSAGVSFIQKTKSMINNLNFGKLRIKFEPSESTMFIDQSTINCLQLVTNATDPKGLTLLKFMNHTKTKMGERILRSNILQPLSNKSSISERLLAVHYLKSDIKLLETVRTELSQCQDLDKLFSLMLLTKSQDFDTLQSQNVNQIILIKQTIQMALSIGLELKNSSCSLLEQIHDILVDEDLLKMKQLIDEHINEDCSWASNSLQLKNQKCYAVKSGKNGLLDISRQLYNAIVNEILSNVESLQDQYKLDLEDSYNSKRGFFIKIMNHKTSECDIPNVFINRSEKKRYLECSTLDIIKCNSRLDDSVNEILSTSNQIIENLLEEISSYLPLLFMVAEALALLDLLQSLSFLSMENNYKCPEFGLNIELKESKHPIAETLVDNFIPNDIVSIKDLSRFQVITGTNMSGKSTYLKQIALIVVMAQMGCFVPAQFAMLKVFKNLKARLCTNTGIVSKGSSFASEMREMVCILEEINEESLIIIDELGNGSSINDGYAISLAICEQLIETNATVFISTHFHKLSTVLSTKIGVVQCHMQTQITTNSDIKMKYRLAHGISGSKRYGINIAEKFFDKILIQRAKDISNFMEYPEKMRKVDESEVLQAKRFYNIVAVLRYIHESDQISQDLLLKIQNEFIQ